MRKVSPERKPIILLFHLLEEKENKGKKKEEAGTSQPIGEIQEPIRESSETGIPSAAGKPLPYRPSPLANKGGDARWRQPEPKNEAFSSNEHSPKWGRFYTPHNKAAN
ncbi:hypothetical protein COP2_020019 [Malus domestica]